MRKGGLLSKLLKKKPDKKGRKGRGSVVIDLAAVQEATTSQYDLWTGNVPLVDLSYFTSEALANLPFFSVLTSVSTAARVRRRHKVMAKIKGKEEPVPDLTVDATRLDKVMTFFQWQQRPAGDVLFSEGDMGDALWMVMEGKVLLTRQPVGADLDGAGGGSSEDIVLAELGNGNWFGEIALTGRQFRSATATTSSACIFLVLTCAKFEELRKAFPDVAEGMQCVISERKASTLKEVPFFELLDDSVLSSLAALFTFEQFRANSVVFRMEDLGDEFYIIIEGSVKITYFDDRCDELILSQLGRNEYFGEIALLHQCPRTAGAVTLENSTMLKLHRRHFDHFRRAVPAIERPFQRAVATRLARTLAKMPLFRTVKENKPWSKTDLLSELFTYKQVQRDEAIMKEGDHAGSSGFNIIVAGEARTTTVAEDGTVVELSRLGPGAWLGEIALLQKRVRTATVTATKPCLVLCLTRQNFGRLMKCVACAAPPQRAPSRRPESAFDFRFIPLFFSPLSLFLFFFSPLFSPSRTLAGRRPRCSRFCEIARANASATQSKPWRATPSVCAMTTRAR